MELSHCFDVIVRDFVAFAHKLLRFLHQEVVDPGMPPWSRRKTYPADPCRGRHKGPSRHILAFPPSKMARVDCYHRPRRIMILRENGERPPPVLYLIPLVRGPTDQL